MLIKGKIHKFGDNVNTDIIIPARFCVTVDPEALGKHCMYDLDSNFAQRVSGNDVIVAGQNFGCGSSREAAPIAIMATGIKCVIAKSFARIFFRNSINIGLHVLESSEIQAIVETGDELTVNLSAKTAVVHGDELSLGPVNSEIVNKIIVSGGLMSFVGSRLANKQTFP